MMSNEIKKGIKITLLALCFVLPMISSAATTVKAPNNLGLVGSWNFDEATSTRVGDTSGNKNNGTLAGATLPTWVAGKHGKALSFDGSNAYVTTSNASQFQFEYNSTFTVSAWIKATTSSVNGFIVAKEQNSGNYTGYYMLLGNDGAPASHKLVVLLQGDTSHYVLVYGSTTLTDGLWHHVTMTSSGSGTAAGVKLYVDGQLETITTSSDNLGARTLINTVPLTIGSRDTGGVPFTGQIDDVRIYNRALSAVDVLNLYKTGSVTTNVVSLKGNKTVTGLVGYWSLDNGSGITASDISGNSNAGTLTNSPIWVAGKYGKALSFNGSSNYVDLGNSSTFDLTSQMTMSVWIRPTNVAQNADPFGKWTTGAGTNNSYTIGIGQDSSNKKLGCGLEQSNNTVKGTNGTTDLVAGVWYHVACVADGSNLTLYLNGVVDGTPTAYDGTIKITTKKLIVGRLREEDTIYSFNGAVDDARLYNRGLTVTEVRALYNNPFGVVGTNTTQNTKLTTGLVGLWSFNGADISGITATDRSGQGNSGTLTNGPVPAIGKVGQALRFDGTNDYVSITNTSSLTFGTGAFTVSGWFYLNSAFNSSSAVSQPILTRWTTDNINLSIGLRGIDYSAGSGSAGVVQMKFEPNGGASYFHGTTNSWIANTWYHFAIIFSANGSGSSVYINGVSEKAGQSNGTAFDDTLLTAPWNFGQGHFDSGNVGATTYLDGRLDDMRVYNRALSTSEVIQLYNMGK